MKVLVLVVLTSLLVGGSGCVKAKYAKTTIGQTFHKAENQEFAWGEVYCGDGEVCAEVEVVRVDVENRDGGRVDVTLHNRTGDQVAVQIAIEILAANGSMVDRTNFYNVALQPRQEQFWTMPGIMKAEHKVRISLRTVS